MIIRRRRRWLLLLPLFLLLPLGGYVLWAATPPVPMPEAVSALASNARVEVVKSAWLVFRPVGVEPTVGLVIYPGGRVDPRAYAPAACTVAEQGYLVVIVPMPLNLAVLAPGRAADIISAYPQIRNWVVGGHSLGGAMAASFAHGNPDKVQGLLLWAAYPAGSDDLSKYPLAVTSIYGTNDGLATRGKIEASRALLPANTVWQTIDGGNHAQFGWYGPQSGDNEATVSREEQQRQIVTGTLALMARVEAMGSEKP